MFVQVDRRSCADDEDWPVGFGSFVYLVAGEYHGHVLCEVFHPRLGQVLTG